MLTKSRYSVKDMILWTRWETLFFFFWAALVAVLYLEAGLTFLNLPWTPIALIGTAVAFMIGFQNNSAYGRIWEARKIWGAIVNTSRAWTMKVLAMVSNDYAGEPATHEELHAYKTKLVHRHIAWLTALRYAMREKKPWEEFEKHSTNKEWSSIMHIPEKVTLLEDELALCLTEDEIEYVMGRSNKATAILELQSNSLKELKERGYLWEFSFLDLESVLETLFDHQGKSERIKNFPYPRQYATLSNYFVWIFILLLPFGIIPEFAKIGVSLMDKYPLIGFHFAWFGVPFCAAVSWVFHTMERIGRTGENPFEGSANDVPISTIARGIEIDIREMLGDDDEIIPGQFPEEHNVQM